MKKMHPDCLAESLGHWVFRLNRAMYAALGDRLAGLGVSPPEWSVLGQIQYGGMTPVILASQMDIDRAAVTRIIDALENKKLLARKPHPTDGRSCLLELTHKGKQLLPKLVAASQETNQLFLRLQSPEKSELLLKLIRNLCEKLPNRVYPLKEFDQTGD